LLDFSFDTEGPNLDFHSDFGVKLGLEIKTISLGNTNTKKAMTEPLLKPAGLLETLAYESPSIVEAKYDSEEMSLKLSEPVALVSPLPPTANQGTEGDLRKCTPKVHTPKVHLTRAPSSRSSSGSSSSSASILSWLPIREPLTPRFNHLRAEGPEEALPQWPPGVKIWGGGGWLTT
jgi:hypothetical protein